MLFNRVIPIEIAFSLVAAAPGPRCYAALASVQISKGAER